MGCAMQDPIETTPPCAADADNKNTGRSLAETAMKQQQHQQPKSQSKSQISVKPQLKEQHSALVQLLESAPLTKKTSSITTIRSRNLICNSTKIPETSLIVDAVVRDQQQHQLSSYSHLQQLPRQTQPPQQSHLNMIFHRKRLKCDMRRNSSELLLVSNDNNNKKCTRPAKIGKTTMIENATTSPAATIVVTAGVPSPQSAVNDPPSTVVISDSKLDFNKCPWKKIRYARELKQKELENLKQKCDNYDASKTYTIGNINDTDKDGENQRRSKDIMDMDMVVDQIMEKSASIYRRDSSDSSCSTMSSSNLSQCTCCYSNGYDTECDDDEEDEEDDDDDERRMHQCNRHLIDENERAISNEKNMSKSDLCDEKNVVADLCQRFEENLSNSGENDGFFRRSIQQKIQYRPCTKNQQCSILRINRNRCQYCRLKKCIAVGMSRDAVRFGRVPKREKARILAAMQQSTQNRGQQRALATELDDQPRLLAAVLRAHMETCEFTREKVSAMRQRARECPSYSMPTLLACPLNPAPELQSEQEFSQRFAHVIRGVIDFAGMIPGFQLLTQDDKFTLLKAGLFDALFVRLICMFDPSINSIICLNGQVMRRDAIQNGANARFLVDSTFNFAERINSMNLTDTEIGLFCAIVLITPDRPGLRNIELIEKMYSRLKACLQTVIAQNRPDQPEFLGELLNTLPDLRTLSTLHTEKLVVFRTEHKELLRQQMWTTDDDQISKSPGSSTWDATVEDVAKSPLGSVSSTESGDLEYSQTSLASSAPLLAATLSGPCPLRHRANSGSSAEDVDIVVGSHAHLTQNGLSITPVTRSHHTHSHHSNNRYRKLDSPTDSGIESGNEKAESTKTVSSGGGSSCSSPRSTVDDVMDEHQQQQHQHHQQHHAQNGCTGNGAAKRQIVEDMPVLKRVLQAPPLYDTNSLMDEAYKPHKKFRALRHRDFETGDADTHMQRPATATPPAMNGGSGSTTPSAVASAPPQQQQSQLHMHLTRNISASQQQQPQQQSSLSSTHSVLAKSLMEEPRMTPEQMKRSDIIQNYIMRDQSTPINSLLVCAANSPTSSTSSASASPNCSSSSSSTTTITLSSPPPPPPQQQHTMRWQGHSVITTTTLRNSQSVSPINSSTGGNYFQSPHSTSISSPSPRASPSSRVQSPRLIELQVDIADSQQPLNLSKKSPTPPPPSHQKTTKIVSTAAIQRSPYHHPVAADITVTTATTNSHGTATGASVAPPQVHKVLLEA